MAIADDVSVAVNGDIRYTGAGPNYTVLELHRFLGDLADDAQASGDDLVDITTDTPSDRSTNQIITLNAPYNIDDTMARHLYDGSITQAGGDTVYSGILLLGSVVAGTEAMIIQDDKVLPPYWGTGINASGANFSRQLIKTRDGGADIDGKRVIVMLRELNDTYAQFEVTLGLANSVAAVSSADDLNDIDTRTTLEGYTTIGNVEGFQLIDIDNDTVDEEYYAQFDIGSQTINDTYEWAKWQTARSLITLNGTDTGTTYIVDNATIVGQAQSFTSRAQVEKLTEARFRLRTNGSPTGPVTAELYASTAGVIPTGSALATSEEVLISLLTSTYQEIIFRFEDNISLTASTQYCIVVRHPTGDASNYVEVEGAASGSVAGENAANENPAATWNAVAGADLWFTVKSSPIWHSRPGEKHRGITHEIVYDGESGSGLVEDQIVHWGTLIPYDGESGTFILGEYVEIQPSGGGTIKNGGKVLFDDTTGNQLYVALENITGNLADDDIITGITSAATANLLTAATDDDKAGGRGVLLAKDDNGTAGDLYIQIIHGLAPVDDLPIYAPTADTDFVLVNATVTARTISTPFIGVSTGTNLIGAYGIGFQTTDVGASDLFFDLTNAPITPPNNVTFTVTGLVNGEDRVLIGPRTGSTLNKAFLQTDTTLSAVTETLIQCSTAIPTDTPGSGTGAGNSRVRVELDSGIYRRVQYDSYSGNDFTITTGPDDDWTGANISTAPKDVFPAYIDVLCNADEEAYSAVYKGSDNNILVRVRDGGGTPIKTNEISAVFGNASSSVAASRITDA